MALDKCHFITVHNDKHYNLDMIISLGYKIKSKIAAKYRIWATERLKEYIINGFALDDERLKVMVEEFIGRNF